MIVQCPQCSKSYRLDDRYSEKKNVIIKCPNCQARFPVEEKVPDVPLPTEERKPEEGKGKKILVADDSPYFRTMVGDILEQEGYDLVFAGDGEEALSTLHSESPDLLILDLHLPKLSGFDVIKEIRRGEIKKDIPILVISSVYTETSHVMALDTIGANDFIDKKFKPEYLIGRVARLLQKETG